MFKENKHFQFLSHFGIEGKKNIIKPLEDNTSHVLHCRYNSALNEYHFLRKKKDSFSVTTWANGGKQNLSMDRTVSILYLNYPRVLILDNKYCYRDISIMDKLNFYGLGFNHVCYCSSLPYEELWLDFMLGDYSEVENATLRKVLIKMDNAEYGGMPSRKSMFLDLIGENSVR